MADDSLIFVCIQCGHGCSTYEDLTEHMEDHEDQKPDMHQLRRGARFSTRIKEKKTKQNNDLSLEDIKDFKIEGENRRTSAYSYPSYTSIGADSLELLDTSWSYGREELRERFGYNDSVASSVPTMAFKNINNNIINNNKEDQGKRTKKSTQLNKKRKASAENNNIVKGAKKKKNSAKKQNIETKEIRRRSTNSMRLRRLTAGGEVCHDESSEMSDTDRLVDVIQRSKIETKLSDLKAGLYEKSKNQKSLKNKKHVDWKKVENLQSRFLKKRTGNGKGNVVGNLQGSRKNSGKGTKGSKTKILSKNAKNLLNKSTAKSQNRNTVIDKGKAQVVLKRGTLKSIPLSGKITPIQGQMIWKLVNSSKQDNSNGLVIPSVEQLKNNATLKFTDQQKVMITFSQNNDSKSQSLKTIIANVSSTSKTTSKTGVRKHQAVLMPVDSLQASGTNNAVSDAVNKIPVKLLRSASKKANLSNYAIIPLSSIISSNSTSVSLSGLVSANQKPVPSTTSTTVALIKTVVSHSKTPVVTASVSSTSTSSTSSASTQNNLKSPSKINITTTTTLTTLQSNLKPVTISTGQQVITQCPNVTITKVITKLHTPVTTTTVSLNQPTRTLVIKQASKPQQILSFLPTTGNSSIPTFQIVPRITTTVAPTTQPPSAFNIQTAQLIRPLILAPRFAAPGTSTTITATSGSSVSIDSNTLNNTRTIYLTANSLNAALKNQGSAVELKSIIGGGIPLLLTAQQSPEKGNLAKSIQIALTTPLQTSVNAPIITQVQTVALAKQAKIIPNPRPTKDVPTTMPAVQKNALSIRPIVAHPQPVVPNLQSVVPTTQQAIAPAQKILIPSQPVIIGKTIPSHVSKSSVSSMPREASTSTSIQTIPAGATKSPLESLSIGVEHVETIITAATEVKKQISESVLTQGQNSSLQESSVSTALTQTTSLFKPGYVESRATSLTSLDLVNAPTNSSQSNSHLPTVESAGDKSLIAKIPLSMLIRSKASDYKNNSLINVTRVLFSEPSVLVQSQSRPLMSSGISISALSQSQSLVGMTSKTPAPLVSYPAAMSVISTASASAIGTMIRLIPVQTQATSQRNIEIRPAVSVNLPDQNLKSTALSVINASTTAVSSQISTVASSSAVIKSSKTITSSSITPSPAWLSEKQPDSLPISIKLASFASGTVLRNSKFLNTISKTSDPLSILKGHDLSRPAITKAQQIPLLPKPTQCIVTLYSAVPKASIIPKMQVVTSVPPTTNAQAQQFPITYLTSVPLQQLTNSSTLPGAYSVIQPSQRTIYPVSFTSVTQVPPVSNAGNVAHTKAPIVVPVTFPNVNINHFAITSRMILTPGYSVVPSTTTNSNSSQSMPHQIIINQPPIFNLPSSTVSRLQKIAPHPSASLVNLQVKSSAGQSISSVVLTNQTQDLRNVVSSNTGASIATKASVLLQQNENSSSTVTQLIDTTPSVVASVNSLPSLPTASAVAHGAEISSSGQSQASEVLSPSNATCINKQGSETEAVPEVTNSGSVNTCSPHTRASGNRQCTAITTTVNNTGTRTSVQSLNTSSEPANTVNPSASPMPHAAADLTKSLQSILKTSIKQGSTITINIQGSPMTYALKDGQLFVVPHDQPPKKEDPDKIDLEPSSGAFTEQKSNISDSSVCASESSETVSKAPCVSLSNEVNVRNEIADSSTSKSACIDGTLNVSEGNHLVASKDTSYTTLRISVPTALLEKKPRKRNSSSNSKTSDSQTLTSENSRSPDSNMPAPPEKITSECQTACSGFPAANDTLLFTDSKSRLDNRTEVSRKRKSPEKDTKFGFECDICSCKFDTYNLMWKHRKVHLNETYNASNPLGAQLPRALCPRFAVCQVCNKWFKDNVDLERHRLVDGNCKNMNSINIIPSPGDQCNKTFVSESSTKTVNQATTCSNSNPNINSNLSPTFSLSVSWSSNVSSRLNPEMISNLNPNVSSNLKSDTNLGIDSHVSSKLISNVTANVSPSVTSNLSSNIGPGASSNTNSKIISNFNSNLSPNVTLNHSTNLSTGDTSNLSSVIGSRVSSNVGSNLTSNFSSNLGSSVCSNLSSNPNSNSLDSISDKIEFPTCDASSTANSIDTMSVSEAMDIELIGDILGNYDYDDQNQVFEDVTDIKQVIKPAKKSRRTSSKTSLSSKSAPSRRGSSVGKNSSIQKRNKRRSRITISEDEEELDDTGLDLDGEFIATGKLYGEFTCSRCDRGFQNEGELDEHNESFHDSLRYNFRERRSLSNIDYLEDFEEDFE